MISSNETSGLPDPARVPFWSARSVAVVLAALLVALCAIDLLTVLNQQSIFNSARAGIAAERAAVEADRAALDEQRRQQEDAKAALRQLGQERQKQQAALDDLRNQVADLAQLSGAMEN